MGDLTAPVTGHADAHTALHAMFNGLVRGPFTLTHSTPGIDTGVTLWTPETGDRIVGLWLEPSQDWSVAGEQLGLGIAGTSDADLAFRSTIPATPTAKPTFSRGQGTGFSTLLEVARLTSTDPIVARTVTGGNTTGSLTLWVMTLAATVF